MEQFLYIISLPDNIPIVMLVIALGFFIWLAAKQAMENDRLLGGGKKNEMYRRMRD